MDTAKEYKVLEINHDNIADWLMENTELVPGKTVAEVIEYLKPDVMANIANELCNYIFEVGVYDDALQYIVNESNILDSLKGKKSQPIT